MTRWPSSGSTSAAQSFPEALSYFPEMNDYNTGPDAYLRHIEEAKRSLSIPVIGSLNGASKGGWVEYGRSIQQSGADALELNIYDVITDPDLCAADVESRYVELLQAVREDVTIPIAVKLGPFFTALPNMVRQLTGAGARGLVLFNRFLQPDIDLETMRVAPNLVLSTSTELRLPLRWIAILRAHVKTSLAASTGVHTAQDAIKLLLAGADVTMIASVLYQHGPDHVRTLLDGIRNWLLAKEYTSVTQMKGSLSLLNAPDPAAFERANYIKTLVNFTGDRDYQLRTRGTVQ